MDCSIVNLHFCMQSALMSEVARPELAPTFNAHEWAVPPSAYDDVAALSAQLTILSYSTDAYVHAWNSTRAFL